MHTRQARKLYGQQSMDEGHILVSQTSSLMGTRGHSLHANAQHTEILLSLVWSLESHESPDTALVGAEADDGGGGALPAAALVVKLRATATSRGSYVAALLAERYTVTISPSEHTYLP